MSVKQIDVNPQSKSLEEMINFSKMINSIFLIALVTVSLIGINVLQNPIDSSAISIFVLLIVVILLFLLFKKGYIKTAGIGLIVIVSVVVTYNFIIAGGINDNGMVIFPVLITISGLIMGKRFIPFMTGLALSEISFIYWLTVSGRITPFDGAVTVYPHNFFTVVVMIVVTGLIIWITVTTIEKNYLKLIKSEYDLRVSYEQTIEGWGNALELFDEETEGHSIRVTELTLKLARRMDIAEPDIEQIRRGARLHDIGKMGVSDQILNKPGPLTIQERYQVEKHPLLAYELLKEIPFLEKALEIPVFHHERWDGSGYPYHMAGKDIPLAARIFAIADNWDALTSDRPYRKAWPVKAVIQYFQEEKGKKFEPGLVDTFLEIFSD